MVQNAIVIGQKTHRSLLPGYIGVKDVMTPEPCRVKLSTSLDLVVRLLLSSVFSGIPVVNDSEQAMGMVTQGDLIYRAGMPLRLGLLAESDHDSLEMVLRSLAEKKAEDVMTRPAITINEGSQVVSAVDLMVKNGLKRLPVVNLEGKLVGMVSRLDIFRTIMRESPDWSTFGEQDIFIHNLAFVSDIMRRDTHTSLPDAPIEEVIRIIDKNDIQRVAVVDKNCKFLGLISDRDLLAAFSDRKTSIWDYLASKVPTQSGRNRREFMARLQAKTASELMKTDLITVREDTPIQEAIKIMTEKGLKRLPVLDSDGRFKGMISRDSLLRTGFAYSDLPRT